MNEAFPIRPLQGMDEYRACVRLQEEVWGHGFSERVPLAVLRVVQRIGGVAAGAFDRDGRLAGFIFGMSGFEGDRRVHWSDMLAVRPEYRDRGLGERLKRHQRDALLPLGVATVYWTFDPLESKNAYFNIARLGAVAAEYHTDFYGESDSPLHRGLGTDRLVARWEIGSERVRRRLEGSHRGNRLDDVAGVPLINPVYDSPAGPASSPPDLGLEAERLRLALPADIQAIKNSAPDLARDWRHHTRAALEAYLTRGYVAIDFTREDGWSSYILARSRRGG